MDKIAAFWPNEIKGKDRLNKSDGMIIFENVGVYNIIENVKKAIKLDVKGIICTSAIEKDIKKLCKIPTYKVSAVYIDLLESIKILEDEHSIHKKKIALLLHKNNQLDINRIKSYTDNDIQKIDFEYLSDIPKCIKYIEDNNFDYMLAGPSGLEYSKNSKIGCFLYQYSLESFIEADRQMRILLNKINEEKIKKYQLEFIVNTLPEAVIITNGKGKIEILNKKATKIFIKVQEKIVGKNFDELVSAFKADTDDFINIDNSIYYVSRRQLDNKDNVGEMIIIEEAENIRQKENRYRALQSKGLVAKYTFDDIIHVSKSMNEIVSEAKAYAKTDLNILIVGETGTGKEMFAQSIHNESSRKFEPFISFNCQSITENIFENELLGIEEGVYNGIRTRSKIGLLEMAHGGTMFLDEIDQMPLVLQGRLLRIIQNKSITKVGGTKIVPIDVRFICATNEDLIQKVECHEFRNDLYYRINTLEVYIPSLKERKEDIVPLFAHFAKLNDVDCSLLKMAIKRIKNMSDYSWPGNARELENFAKRSSLFNNLPRLMNGELEYNVNTIQGNYLSKEKIHIKLDSLEKMKKEIVQMLLEKNSGNISKTAKELGISRNTLMKMK